MWSFIHIIHPTMDHEKRVRKEEDGKSKYVAWSFYQYLAENWLYFLAGKSLAREFTGFYILARHEVYFQI